jgi:hypothetical protein
MTAASRNHALDKLRGVMMWLGIVLHVAAVLRKRIAGPPASHAKAGDAS